MIRYNFGGGPKKIEGFKNVDILDWNGATDIIWDLTKTPYDFVKDYVDEIQAVELLEHISFRDTTRVLKEWYRILKPDGKLVIQVPDIGKMIEYYINNEICDCVPHKANNWRGFKADPWCTKCDGRGKINPVRWLYAFTGAQKHEFDTHRNIFTRDILRKNLEDAGFKKVDFEENIYKIIAICRK